MFWLKIQKINFDYILGPVNYLQNMGRFSALPTQSELAEMKEDLAFKEGEMKKSEYTALGLASGK